MSHHTVRSAYQDLAERINRFPLGAPPSDVLFAILKMLFSEREAGLVAQLPIKPFTVADAAGRWKLPEAEAQRVLDALSDRAILLDVARGRLTFGQQRIQDSEARIQGAWSDDERGDDKRTPGYAGHSHAAPRTPLESV